MTRDSSAVRWLGLEIGSQRYAVDLHEISHALIWPKKTVTCTRGLPNTQGLFVHDGRPIVVVDPDLLFQGLSHGTSDLPIAPDNHLAPKASTASPITAASDSWLVIFRSTPGVVACGIRVDRTVGPFRVASTMLQEQTNAATEVEYSGLRWRIVTATSVTPAPYSSNLSAEEPLP